MKTENMNTALKSVVAAANSLGVLAEHPSLPRQAADLARRVCDEADTTTLISEHAALVAVAEASAIYCENFFGKPTPNEKKLLKALANLAAVRAGSEVSK